MNAGRHALGWLVAGNAAGLWLSLLLLFPGLQAGEWTYGRWMPVHLNVQLYGWTALPLAGWLLWIYGVSSRWSEAAVRAWSAALLAGVLSWLGGGTSGKVFLDWKGGPLLAFVAALAFLWAVLAAAWFRNSRQWTGPKRWLCLAGLMLLAAVPFGMLHASSPAVYPPVDRGTGGPTGASLLGSTLIVVGLLMLLPRACGIEPKRPGLPVKTLAFFAASWIVFALAEARGGTHFDFLQIGALALLLPWPWLVVRDWRNFRWPVRPHGWRMALLLWWGLLVVTGFIAFLPGILDRLKFTHGLVAHSHLAMAGFTTAFCALLLRLRGDRFGGMVSTVAWNAAALIMVAVLAATGWAESKHLTWMAEPPAWRTAALALRALCGLVMLGASVHWFTTWQPSTDHEENRNPLEQGRRRDGRGHGPDADPRPGAGPAAARDPGTAAGSPDLPPLDRRLRGFDRPFLHLGAARRDRGGNGVGLHRDDPAGGRGVSGLDDPGRSPGGTMGTGGRGGRGGGRGPDSRPEGGMVEDKGLTPALRAAGVVAMVYAHFLIFAQFSWVELIRAGGATPFQEKLALGLMAAAGIAAGFITSARNTRPAVLRISFLAAAASAALGPLAPSMPLAFAVSIVTGASIGVMTVTLATLLPRWCGVAWVGLGTGLGYALCNIPAVFLAPPGHQAFIGAAFSIAGALLVPRHAHLPTSRPAATSDPGIVAAVAAFTALVWLDSAAFFIIQHEQDLKAGTWGGAMLWRNAAVHLGIALFAGWWLRRGFSALLAAAWAILAIAALAVNSPATRGIAGWWYPAGVSLYSTALVAWPGFFSSDADPRRIARRAAWLFAIAGWFGSANGIGMAESLHRVPEAFVAVAGLVVLGVLFHRRAKLPTAMAMAGIALIAGFSRTSPAPERSAVARGRGVYLAEGCIHCHSRYVRPVSADILPWGPASNPATTLAERPVLIGNRRQGPDLTNVGIRRSAAWLKEHFLDPRGLVHGSPMPSYAYLFEDGRGDDLVAFLRDTTGAAAGTRAAAVLSWTPAPGPEIPDGAPLFSRHCVACHGPVGHGDGKLATRFVKSPADLDRGPFIWTPAGPDLESRLARVIKFGIAGTDMPGHETLTDAQTVALARYVRYLRQE